MSASNILIFNYTNHSGIPSNNTKSIFSGRRPELLTWLVVTGGVTFLGVCLNTFALIAVWPQSTRRSGFSWLISHFVLLHLIMCLVNLPANVFMVLAKSEDRWMPPDICEYIQTLWGVTVALINWSDATLGFNRCIALFFPHHYGAWSRKCSNIFLISFAWMICVGIRMAASLVVYVGPNPSNVMVMTPTGQCSFLAASGGILAAIYVNITTAVPFTLTGLFAVLIFGKSVQLTCTPPANKTVRQAAEMADRSRDYPSPALRYRLKMARMLLFTFLWTAMCNSPNVVVLTFFPQAVKGLAVSALWLRVPSAFQFSLTPVILLLVNVEYRKRLFGALHVTSRIIRPISNTGAAGTRSKSLPAED